MNYDEVKNFYPVAVLIARTLYDNDCTFQISTGTFLLYKDRKEVIITPQIEERTLTLKSISTNLIDKELLMEIDADLWFNLSLEHQLPFEYERIEKLKSIDGKFHILMRVQNER